MLEKIVQFFTKSTGPVSDSESQDASLENLKLSDIQKRSLLNF